MDLTWHKFPQFCAFALRAGLWAQMWRGRTGFFQDWVSQGREYGLWVGWRSFRPLLFSLNSWEFPRCLEFEVILQQRRMGQQVSAYSVAEMKTSWKHFTLWCSSGNSVQLKAHTIYKPQLHISGLERDTKSFYIFPWMLADRRVQCVLECFNRFSFFTRNYGFVYLKHSKAYFL